MWEAEWYRYISSLAVRNANEQAVSPSDQFIPLLTTRKCITLTLLRKFLFCAGSRTPISRSSSKQSTHHTEHSSGSEVSCNRNIFSGTACTCRTHMEDGNRSLILQLSSLNCSSLCCLLISSLISVLESYSILWLLFSILYPLTRPFLFPYPLLMSASW
jgi:hypothetical protein